MPKMNSPKGTHLAAATEENRHSLKKLLTAQEETYGKAITFAALSVFSTILVLKIISAFEKGNVEGFEFLMQFWNEGFNDWQVAWFLFAYIVLHAIRLQMGIVFDLYDKSYINALEELPLHTAQRILRVNTACRLWLMMCLATISFLLSHGNFLSTAINLAVLGGALVIYDINSLRRYFVDKDKFKNIAIVFGDILFCLLVSIIFHHGERTGPGELTNTPFGMVVVIPIVVISLVFFYEVFFVYRGALVDATRDFMNVVVAFPWWSRKKT